jgi:hypothetical protein
MTSSGLTISITHEAAGSTSPINPSTATWQPVTPATWETDSCAFINDGKLYFNTAYLAQGSVAGIVGTWVVTYSSYDGTTAATYYKDVNTYLANGSLKREYYSSATGTFSATPDTTQTVSYTAANGVATITTSTKTIKKAYKIIGAYLVIVNGTDPDVLAFVKQ